MPHLRRDQGVTVQLTTSGDLRAVLAAVGSAHLPAQHWEQVSEVLAELGDAVDADDPLAIDTIGHRLNNVIFAARVRARLGGSRRPAPAVAPTKQSPALPIAGAVCGAVLLGLGWALGGGVLLVGTGALALFVLGIALAGTTTISKRRGGDAQADPQEALVGPPGAVVRLLTEVESQLE